VHRSFENTGVEVVIGMHMDDIESEAPVYWFLRRAISRSPETSDRANTGYASSRLCPVALEQLTRLEELEMPRPDVIGHGREYQIVILDGARYRLRGRALHADGQSAGYEIDSNVGSPLARWVDAMLAALEPCWTPVSEP